MTAAVLTQLPLAAGSALAGSLGRLALWGLGRYARAPLSNTAILALAGFSLLAGGNALYFQSHRHPAPLFGVPAQEIAAVQPVTPAVRPKPKPKLPLVQSTGSVPALAAASEPIGNAEVLELQRKLQAFGLFDGTVDGYYGPKTARAIKRFEERQGLKIKGELTPEILRGILSAPIIAPQPAPAPIAAPQPVAEEPVVMTETVQLATPQTLPSVLTVPDQGAAPLAVADPLPAPAPLQPAIETATVGKPVLAERPLPETTDEALEIASIVAGNAIGALVAVVNGGVQLGPATQPLPPKPQAEPQASPQRSPDAVADIVTAEMTPVPTTPTSPAQVNDPRLIAKVQRGLSSLGFLSGEIDGVPGEATAKAIRNFEVWNNYDVTGRVSPELLELLVAAGADI